MIETIFVAIIFGGIASLLINISSLLKKYVFKKDVLNEEKANDLNFTKPKSNFRSFLFMTALFLFIGVIMLGFSFDDEKEEQKVSSSSAISSAVNSMKEQVNFPYKIDEYTTWVDVEPEREAIRYHYELANYPLDHLDTSELITIFKKEISEQACNDSRTRKLLNYMNMEYVYLMKDTLKTFMLTISKSDCLN